MVNSCDVRYISIVSGSLRNFKHKGSGLWQFSCPFCGDSKRDKRKARGYFIEKDGKVFYKCHNCQLSQHFSQFLKTLNPQIYQQYSFERLGNDNERTLIVTDKNVSKETKIKIPKLSDLPRDHISNVYFDIRKLPEWARSEIYYTENFKSFATEVFDEKYRNLREDERIVLISRSKDGKVLLAQGRALDPANKMRYVSAKHPNANQPIFFGMERVNIFDCVYVVEGAFDSFFLPNCISVGSSNLSSVTTLFKDFHGDVQKHNTLSRFILVHDNQPRNKEVMKEMSKSIGLGFNVCIYPSTVKQKDINEMHLHGIDVYDMIRKNVYNGTRAKIMFEQFRKVR